jgi:hypothetical protein
MWSDSIEIMNPYEATKESIEIESKIEEEQKRIFKLKIKYKVYLLRLLCVDSDDLCDVKPLSFEEFCKQ